MNTTPQNPEGKEEEYQRLVELFRAAGAEEPESWASSQINENFAQLARFCFLRSLWPGVIDQWRQNTKWITFAISQAEQDSQGFFADAGIALKSLLELGATRDQLATVARMVAYEVAFGVVYRIDEGADWDYGPDKGYPAWELREIGSDDMPTGRRVGGLHEDLLSLDPSGREGRPE
jgi:hypothetical protein